MFFKVTSTASSPIQGIQIKMLTTGPTEPVEKNP